ncbi:MAG: DUF302 domain-containing protein [Acidimicrobiales bacterium]
MAWPGALETTLPLPLAEAEGLVRASLSRQGFGVLTEIDVQATLQAKLGADWHPFKILGACNPAIAHQALQLDPAIALMLPCNVVLEEQVQGQTHVAIADPRAVMPGPGFKPVADQALARLEVVLQELIPVSQAG